MSEMIERVAEAIRKGVCKNCRRPCIGDGEGMTPHCDRTECEWDVATRHERARLAIEAMREPTKEMAARPGFFAEAWRGAIDEALK